MVTLGKTLTGKTPMRIGLKVATELTINIRLHVQVRRYPMLKYLPIVEPLVAPTHWTTLPSELL